ncbi:MAG: hypothetical protein IJH62_09025 [Mogibacterium sp.]|nr:hypothetical protein [Mogibacterium sp.]
MTRRAMTILAMIVIAAGMLAVTSCTNEEFSMIGESEKYITVTAKSASKGSNAMTGGLEVAEGEGIELTSTLDSGEVRIEIYAGPEEQSADEIPEPEGEAVMTFNAAGSSRLSGEVGPGYYFVSAEVTEQASGSVTIEVKSMEQA